MATKAELSATIDRLQSTIDRLRAEIDDLRQPHESQQADIDVAADDLAIEIASCVRKFKAKMKAKVGK